LLPELTALVGEVGDGAVFGVAVVFVAAADDGTGVPARPLFGVTAGLTVEAGLAKLLAGGLLPGAGLLAGVAVWLCAGCVLVAVGAAFDCALEAAAAARSWFQTASLPPFSRYLRKESLAICCSLGVPFARFTALASSQYASALLPLLPERIAWANP
jgi:hypothetical protein